MATQKKTAIAPAAAAAARVSAYHNDVIGYIEAGQRAAGTMLDRMVARIIKQYGPCKLAKPPKELNKDGTRAKVGGPTKAQYDADQVALAKLAKDRGLASNQWVRKPYATAIKAVYGTLPIDESAAALRKRLARVAAGGAMGHADRAPAPKGRKAGEPQDKAASVPEQIEQAVTTWGIPATLEAVARILDADKKTMLAAKAMRAIVGEMKGGAPVKVIADARDTRKAA